MRDKVKHQLPPMVPLDMPEQDLGTPYCDPAIPGGAGAPRLVELRLALIASVLALTGLGVHQIVQILKPGGLSPMEIAVAVFFSLSFVGIAIGCVTALYGVFVMVRGADPANPATPENTAPISVAVLVLTYNEDPVPIFSNVAAMARGLSPCGGRHGFSVYVLSDTTDPAVADAELDAYDHLTARVGPPIPVHYRHRPRNTDRKVGNLRNWCTRWGGRHDAMMVLDADSLMAPEAIMELADHLSSDRRTGLIQTVPRIANDRSIFARLTAFSNALTGSVFAQGLARWAGGDSNYWGHNAIIRTRAFAAAAGLPHLSGPAPYGGLVLSHDFIEAALIRRAGWKVVMRPDIEDSFEEAPPTLADYVARDSRWCQGNLQHIRLLGVAGFHPVSRFHLLNGIMSYLSAPIWAAFLVVGTWIALQGRSMPIDYFSDPRSPFPTWPELDSEKAFALLFITAGVVLTPKLAGLFAVLIFDPLARRWGGWFRLLPTVLIETIVSALVAPVLMVHQCRAVFRTLFGRDGGWKPQNRRGSPARFCALLRFHWLETVIGIGLLCGMSLGAITLLMLPIAVSLTLATPMSAFLSLKAPGAFAVTPHNRFRPDILGARDGMRAQMDVAREPSPNANPA